jgi:hypothetical protein
MSLIERAEAIIHDWTCGCGKGQACPNRDGCREAAEQIAADPATTQGAVDLKAATDRVMALMIREYGAGRSEETREQAERLARTALGAQ